MRPRNKPPGTGSNAPQTSDEIYTCTKSYGAMNANDPVIIQPITCKLSCKNRNSDQIIPWKCWNIQLLSEMTLFWPENKTPFYLFVSDPVSDPDSNPDPKCLFRIRIGSGYGQKLIRNTAEKIPKNLKAVFYIMSLNEGIVKNPQMTCAHGSWNTTDIFN